MRTLPALLVLALLTAACGNEEETGELIGDPTPAELANRIEAVGQVQPEKEQEKALPRRLGVISEAQLPAEYRSGRSCRLSDGGNLLLVAAAQGAAAKVDGRMTALRTAGPVGPTGGFWEAPGISVSIALKAPGVPAAANLSMAAGVTVGGSDDRPIQRLEASWSCVG